MGKKGKKSNPSDPNQQTQSSGDGKNKGRDDGNGPPQQKEQQPEQFKQKHQQSQHQSRQRPQKNANINVSETEKEEGAWGGISQQQRGQGPQQQQQQPQGPQQRGQGPQQRGQGPQQRGQGPQQRGQGPQQQQGPQQRGQGFQQQQDLQQRGQGFQQQQPLQGPQQRGQGPQHGEWGFKCQQEQPQSVPQQLRQGYQQQQQKLQAPQQRGQGPQQQQQPQGPQQRGQGFQQQQGPQQRTQGPQQKQDPQQRGQGSQKQQVPQQRRQGVQQQQDPQHRGQGFQQQQQLQGPQQRGQGPQQQLQGPQQRGQDFQQQQGPQHGVQQQQQQRQGSKQQQQSSQHQQKTGQFKQMPYTGSARGHGDPQEAQAQTFRSVSQGQLQQEPAQVSCAGIKRGTLGLSSIVETNYFTMDLSKMPDIAYHYDVAITPDRPKKLMRNVFNQCRQQYFPKVALVFDGSKNCYTVDRLEKPMYTFKIEVADSNLPMKEFNIQIKETDTPEVELKSLKSYHKDRIFDKPMRALQALEVVLSYAYHEHGLRVGRSYYRKPQEMYDLRDGYEMYTGIYQAAILGEEPLLNIDISHKSFPKAQSVTEYLREIGVHNLTSPIGRSNMYKVARYLKGITVFYTPPECFGASERQYKISGVGDAASKTYFETDDGKRMFVSDYYNMRGYKLAYPHLNCLEIKTGQRYISLPMELCKILAYQSLMRKDAQVSQIIRHSATSTTERKEKIINLLNAFQSKETFITQQFGITLGRNFIQVQMRLLQAPDVQYVGGFVTPKAGSWQIGNKCRFLETTKPSGGHKWAIIYADGSRIHDVVDGFRDCIYKAAQRLNVNLSQNCEIESFQNIEGALQKLGEAQFALVFVILPPFGTSYSNVKQAAELKYGVLTQCIKEPTVQRSLKDLSVCNNLLLKVNAKLNGTNHKVADDRDEKLCQLLMPLKNVMFLGADVTHPSPDQRDIPSVVGVAASHDEHGACYNMQYRLQKAKLEDIEDMESITIHHLQVYKNYQKRYPDYIIYYRDGVSDGQFPIIRDRELGGIRSACEKLNCNPKLTCLVVVKRHHTRFFPLTPSKRDRFNNVEPGTVVDQRIVHPNEIQFFLVSHQAIQGTAKPSRYNVIEDDAKFNVDILQKLSYNLCHLFPRCNRAVSYPAPAYLAHLVAFRGRVYLEGVKKFGNLKAEYEKRMVSNNFMQRNPMYFV